MKTLVNAPKVTLYLTGTLAEAARVRACASELMRVHELQVTAHLLEDPDGPVVNNSLSSEEKLARFHSVCALVRRASILWFLWPETAAGEWMLGSLGYALAHRWHVGLRAHVVVSGARTGVGVLTQAADYRTREDAAAFRHCVERAKRVAFAQDV